MSVRHWFNKLLKRGGHHHPFCSCQVVAYIWVGRGSVQPGMPMAPEEVEVIVSER